MTRTPVNAVAAAALLLLAAAPTLAADAAPVATKTAAAAAQLPKAGTLAVPPGPMQSPSDWIEYEDSTVSPVLDDVSRQLAAARTALTAKDSAKAAAAMQAAARALAVQADRAAEIDRQRAAADMKLAHETRERMAALVHKLDATATQLKAGKVASTAALDKTLDKAARADLERRWLVSDVATWYPVSEEPQRHLGAALDAYARKDFQAAAGELRKASAYLRLEAARATGDAHSALVDAQASVDRSAKALDHGTLKDAKALEQVVVRADHALAVAHRAHATEAWSRKAYDRAGYELKAAAHDLEGAAALSDDKVRAVAAAAVKSARETGDKLANGGVWTRDEVAEGFEAMGHSLDDIGRAIGVKHKAAPFDVPH